MIYSPRLSPPHIFQRTWTRFSSFVANGLMTAVRRYEEDANDVVTSIAESLYTYNANNAVTSITHKNPNGTQIVQHSYTYDSTNNIVEYLNSIDGQTSYDYDFLGQLIGADYANGSISDETYTYDENGNRVTANGNTYTTGTNNELTSDGDFTYTYDAEGNRISKTNVANTERELYTWDYRNRLTTVTKQTYDTLTNEWTTVQIVEYAYDYNNIWIRKVIGNSKTIFIPENYQTTIQIDNGTTTHHYLWTPNQQDKLLADTTTSGILWALTDHLGTIRDVLDGNSSTHLTYDAFGNLISGTNPLLFGFTGKAFDTDTNLQNNINRWYDALIGRWLSVDPIGFNGNDTNLYRYVKNTILKLLDIFGLDFFTTDPFERISKSFDFFKSRPEWYDFIPPIVLFEPTSDCPCSLKWDNGLWGNLNTSNGKFDVDWQPKKGFNIAGLYEGPGMSITGTASNDGYQVGTNLQLPGMSIAGIASNDGYQVSAGLQHFIMSITGMVSNDGYQVGTNLQLPGMSIAGIASNDGYQVGARLQLPIMSIAGIANNDEYQVGANLQLPGISIIGNIGNNGSNLGVVLPILDGGALGGIYKNGQLGIQGIVPIKHIIKIDGYYIDKSTWEINCIPFEISIDQLLKEILR